MSTYKRDDKAFKAKLAARADSIKLESELLKQEQINQLVRNVVRVSAPPVKKSNVPAYFYAGGIIMALTLAAVGAVTAAFILAIIVIGFGEASK